MTVAAKLTHDEAIVVDYICKSDCGYRKADDQKSLASRIIREEHLSQDCYEKILEAIQSLIRSRNLRCRGQGYYSLTDKI